PLARAPTTSPLSARCSRCLARAAATAGLRPGSRRPASASGSACPVRTASSSPSPHLPSGRRISELLAGDGAHLAVALGQVLPPTGDLGGVDQASLQLVEVRQGDRHGDSGRRSLAGLPSEGHQEPGTSRGAAEECEGEEDASHPSPPPTTAISRTASSNASLSSGEGRRSPTLWLPAESAIGSEPHPPPSTASVLGAIAQTPVLPKPCAPRSVGESSSTTSTSTRATGAITSWAMRMQGSMANG